MTSAQQKLRLEQLKKLAAEGLSTWQAAIRLGLTRDRVRALAAKHGMRLAKEEP